MRSFDWIDSLPSDFDPLPRHFSQQIQVDEHEDDDDGPIERVNDIPADLFIRIDYQNAGGVPSTRWITVKSFSKSNGLLSVMAWCHYRKAIKKFRLDRINSIVTTDGEIFEPANKFWESVGYRTSISNSNSQPPDPTFAASSLKRKFQNELVVLASLSRSDGTTHEREVDSVIDYLERELEWDQISLHPNEVSEIRNYFRRMRISRERLYDCLNNLLSVPGKARLYAKQLDRFFKCAIDLVNSDGLQHPSELAFLDNLYLEMTNS